MAFPSQVKPRAVVREALERAALIGLSVALLLGLEALLRVSGFGSDSYGALDFGIPLDPRVFEVDAADPDMMVVAPWIFEVGKSARRELINVDEFSRVRPEGELRLVAVGGSTVFGYPTGGPIAFPCQLGELVQKRHPEISLDVINLGIPGYDARRTLRVVREALEYDPSIIIYYTGHNEYLRRFTLESLQHLGWKIRWRQRLCRLRTYQILTRMLRPITGRGSPEPIDVSELTQALEKREGFRQPRSQLETEMVVQKYRNNLQLAIDETRQAGVPLVLCTVVSNVKAYPKHTVFDAGVTQEQIAAAEGRRLVIKRAARRGNFARMEAEAEKGLAIVPGHARYHHYLAQAQEGLGKLDAALASYINSRELETTQRRGGIAVATAIRELGERGGATVVDLEAIFLADMEHGHWGEELFLDYCHPNPDGHGIIAEAIYGSVDWATLSR